MTEKTGDKHVLCTEAQIEVECFNIVKQIFFIVLNHSLVNMKVWLIIY